MITFDLQQFCRPGDTFVEIGTGLCGGLVTALGCGFVKLHSIEVDPTRCASAMVRFKDEIVSGRLSLYCGTSQEWLPHICEQLGDDRCVWWVDAHMDHPTPNRSPSACSVFDDLKNLLHASRGRDTVLVDDRRLFDGPGWGATITETAVREALLLLHPTTEIYTIDNVFADDVLVSDPQC